MKLINYLILLIFTTIKIDAQDICVKILLQQINHNESLTLSLKSEQKFIISFSNEPTKKYTTTGPLEICIKKEGSALAIASGNKKSKASAQGITITPESGHLELNNKHYEGSLCIHIDKEKIYVINRLPLERYVYSVLKTESWPGWPLEVNKAFAIASRTYVLHQRKLARQTKQLYDIKDTTAHQTYSGYHETPVLMEAVELTKHMFVGYKNEAILAMFDCCCGGVIPAFIEHGINFSIAPYLKRTEKCLHCENCKLYEWDTEIDLKEFEEKIRCHIPNLKDIREIKIQRRDKAGLVNKIIIKDKKASHVIGGRKIYSLIGNKKIKSFHYNLKKTSDKIQASGKGLGHHLGLCQWGAKAMVEKGHSFIDVLQFYYPGTNIMKLIINN
jgi:stage II sporulation protein D